MPPTPKPNEGLLARVNFPLYSVEMLTSRHILVAGGGGSSKTGVANGFEIYEVSYNGENFVAKEILRHETGPSVVMNCAVRPAEYETLLVAGQESNCQKYKITPKIIRDEVMKPKVEEKKKTRNRKASKAKKSSEVEDIEPVELSFNIQTDKMIQTDFAESEPLQRVVRISPNGQMMATGGLDGCIRVWNFPKMTKLTEISGHTREVDDLDFSTDSKLLVSVSKDGLGVIWDLASGKESIKLEWTPPAGIKYLFKRCRFGSIEGRPDRFRLFTLANPFGKGGKARGFLQQWNIETGKLSTIVEVEESLASLTVREDGRFVAIGSMFTGSVSIYVAFSLQRVLHIPHAHSMFVTGLTFLPITDIDGPAITSNAEAAVVSISVDNRVCIHALKHRHSLPEWLAVIIIVVLLILTFICCSLLGL